MTRFEQVQELSQIILNAYHHEESTPNGRVFCISGGKLVGTEEFAKHLIHYHFPPDQNNHRLRGVVDDIHRILREAGFQLKTHESSQSDSPESDDPPSSLPHHHSITVTLPDGKEILVTVTSTDPDPAIGLTLIERLRTPSSTLIQD